MFTIYTNDNIIKLPKLKKELDMQLKFPEKIDIQKFLNESIKPDDDSEEFEVLKSYFESCSINESKHLVISGLSIAKNQYSYIVISWDYNSDLEDFVIESSISPELNTFEAAKGFAEDCCNSREI